MYFLSNRNIKRLVYCQAPIQIVKSNVSSVGLRQREDLEKWLPENCSCLPEISGCPGWLCCWAGNFAKLLVALRRPFNRRPFIIEAFA